MDNFPSTEDYSNYPIVQYSTNSKHRTMRSGNTTTRGLKYSFINDETNVWIIIMIMTFVVFLALVVGVHECYRSMEKRRRTTTTTVNNSSPTTGHRNNGDIDEDSHSIATTVDDETD